MITRILRWVRAQLIEPGPAHNHEEGEWRADCPATRCQAKTEEWIRRNAR